ncbi:MAG: hypothetical protein KGD63_05760 [Candidatus Lokiarchaeota archaeon]|nr:hypothetical protein [Candidatus Lokiarchaeota archaeon]
MEILFNKIIMNILNLNIEKFFQEIYNILKSSKKELDEPWFLIKEIEYLINFNDFEIDCFLSSFDFIKKEQWNHISINKIQFILESLKILDYDVSKLSRFLSYQGFEQLIKEILKLEGYSVISNFRFSDKSYFKYETNQKRYEIDVIGLKNNFLLLIDAKQYNKRDSFSALNKAADLQYRRLIALKKNKEVLDSIISDLVKYPNKLKKKLPLKLIPIIITLEESSFKTSCDQIPLVSIYKIKSFLNELKDNLQFFNYIKINKISIQKHLE